MVFGLSTSHEIGLAVTGAIFIIFALVSSFVFPHFDPNFPGPRGLRWYLPLCFVFFIAMLSAVLYFGQEQKTAEATPGQPAPAGNTANGKAVFMSAGCAACHTFTPAGTKGTVGPDLDSLKDYASKAGEPLGAFTTAAITHPPAKYVPPGFQNTMPTNFGQTLTPKQLTDLVAFLDAPAGP
ncbi:MAG TPA: cytochrome c [Polyangiaceae bacterium]